MRKFNKVWLLLICLWVAIGIINIVCYFALGRITLVSFLCCWISVIVSLFCLKEQEKFLVWYRETNMVLMEKLHEKISRQ